MQLPNELGVPFDYTVHDFSPICPQFHLNDKMVIFVVCHEDECNECIVSRPNPWQKISPLGGQPSKVCLLMQGE